MACSHLALRPDSNFGFEKLTGAQDLYGRPLRDSLKTSKFPNIRQWSADLGFPSGLAPKSRPFPLKRKPQKAARQVREPRAALRSRDMELACVRCAQRARAPERLRSAPAASPGRSSGRRTGGISGETGGAVRCEGCGGFFHAPCVTDALRLSSGDGDASVDWTAFKCAACVGGASEDADRLPLMVPVEALPYLQGRDAGDDSGDESAELDQGEWIVVKKTVEVCVSCRQVDVAGEDRAPCGGCGAARVHLKCTQAEPAKKSKAGGRKRRRSKSSGVGQCVNCLPVKVTAVGAIATRTVALLVRGDSSAAQWTKACSACQHKYCLQDFCDADDRDPTLNGDDRATRDDDNDNWICWHCRQAVYDTNAAVIATIKDEPLPVAVPTEIVTILICDGCEGEYEMASIFPPLTQVPEGDWFCPQCDQVRALICDGCEGEYDMARLDPPISEVPDGDWFCPQCKTARAEAAEEDEDFVKTEVDASEDHTANSSSYKHLLVKEEPTLIDSANVIICDACERRFDKTKVGLNQQPGEDWFCGGCENERRKRKKGKSALKMMKRAEKALAAGAPLKMSPKHAVPSSKAPKKALSAATATTPLKPVEIVTILICDGCEGEFDPRLLVPPLLRIPEGEWFCDSCSLHRSKRKRGGSGKPEPVRDAHRVCAGCDARLPNSKTPGGPNDIRFCDHCQLVQPSYFKKPLNVADGSSVGAPRKRGRPKGSYSKPRSKIQRRLSQNDIGESESAGDGLDSEMEEGSVLPLILPQPLKWFKALVGSRRLGSNQEISSIEVVDGADAQYDSVDDDADEDDRIVIICDICFSEYRMVDVIGSNDPNDIPARPWYCVSCLRALKRNRKKRQRFSKQMVLEFQLYGGLLRATSAKVVDAYVSALSGKLPRSTSDRKLMYGLVGKTVGVYFTWDKMWVLGRVVFFDESHPSMHHTIRFPDGVVRSLPLYALPIVIGTESFVNVKVPSTYNRWWPAQLLRMNLLSKRLLLPTTDDEDIAFSQYRLVRIFSGSDSRGSLSNKSSWVPKYLCRPSVCHPSDDWDTSELSLEAMAEINEKHSEAEKESTAEVSEEQSTVSSALSRLLKEFSIKYISDEDRLRSVAEALVGLQVEIPIDGKASNMYNILNYDIETGTHEIQSEDLSKETEKANLLYSLRTAHLLLPSSPSAFSDLAVKLGERGDRDAEMQSNLIKDMAKDASVGPSLNKLQNAPQEQPKVCAHCQMDTSVLKNEVGGSDLPPEDMINCSRCSTFYHITCCDPPYMPVPLYSDETGEVLVRDLKVPYVCSDCTSCAGCEGGKLAGSTDTEVGVRPKWSRWQQPLSSVSLCESCVPYYNTKCFCSVCDHILNDDALATCVSLLTCTTCQHWVHAECEPDSHPAFHNASANEDFELDVLVDPVNLTIKQNGEGPESSSTEVTSTIKEEAKPTKQVDEDFAHSLRFRTGYDPRVLNKYECLTCRKVRMLRVIHRLVLEDKIDLFKEPVTEAIAPTYFDVIKSPMDLSTMQRKILDNAYPSTNFREFRDDFELMCLNAVTFNSKERDFLIWREAWRFYGQGQRIFRQTAPKSRMKQRGGKYYDALVIAAKRQLPNNSSLGKQQLDDDDDDEGGQSDKDETEPMDQEAAVDKGAASSIHDAHNGPATVNGHGNKQSTTEEGDTNAVHANGVLSAPTDSSAERLSSATDVLVKGAHETLTVSLPSTVDTLQRRGNLIRTPRDSFVIQSEVARLNGPTPQVELFSITQTRTAAHEYCWMDMCVTCGSAGRRDDMIFCVDCGECFHTFCTPDMTQEVLSTNERLRTYWRCQNCTLCEVCGCPPASDEGLYSCANCARGFHGCCLIPVIRSNSKTSVKSANGGISNEDANKKRIFCSSCVTCEECNTPQPEQTYSFDLHMCLPCRKRKDTETKLQQEKSKPLAKIWALFARKQRNDNERCPMCYQRWRADDEDLIQCDGCERWAHPKCDLLLTAEPEQYTKLVNDPSAPYICASCRPKQRTYLSDLPDMAKCQVLVDAIQRKRIQCDAKWKEARHQLTKERQWKAWADNTAVYLYILRLGEECLRTFCYRSVNFKDDWFRFSKAQELEKDKVELPAWLVQKASRYLRSKRYCRGPRAAQRRRARKTSNFYSKQGVSAHEDPSAVCSIVAEACSCAALLACIHLLYGWRPLPKVVLHLLSEASVRSMEGCVEPELLSEGLLQRLRVDDSGRTLEEEIAIINHQYDRRVAKRHLVRDEPPDDLIIFGENDTDVLVSVVDDATELNKDPKGESKKESQNKSADPEPPKPDATSTEDNHATVSMTVGTPLLGWPVRDNAISDTTDPNNSSDSRISEVTRPTPFIDNRFCALCYLVGDDTACGRLISTDQDQWVHVNCAMWSVEVYESEGGVLQKCQRAKLRSRLVRCDVCNIVGATIGCSVSRCPKHYHFPCAVDLGVVFLPNGETCCPNPEHIAMIASKYSMGVKPLPPPSENVECGQDTASEQEDETSLKKFVSEGEKHLENNSLAQATNEATKDTDGQSSVAQSVLPIVDPVPEPRRALLSDPPLVSLDSKKKKTSSESWAKKKRLTCFRVGALTVHSLGHIVVGNPKFHSRDAIYPLGFRSSRIFWSTRHVGARCLYECTVSSSDVEARLKERKHRETVEAAAKLGMGNSEETPVHKRAVAMQASDEPERATAKRSNPLPVFKITPSDDLDNPIVASTAKDALIELRSRVVALYDDPKLFGSASSNPFLNRTSWFSFALSSSYFFGFGIPAIASVIEELPFAATTGISRRFIAQRHRQDTMRRRHGASSPVAFDQSKTDTESETDEQVYQFTQHLPSPEDFAIAQRIVEELVVADERSRQSSGSARTDGFEGNRLFGAPSTTKAKPRRQLLAKQATNEPVETSSNSAAGNNATAKSGANGNASAGAMDLEHLPIAMQYRELRKRPFDERLLVRKSKIHGFGLFLKEKVGDGQMIVEYQGQMISQAVADEREKKYEEMGIGSCYMFRLDEKTIIDATRTGNLARFINHSCDPKAYARVVTVENNEKKIVIFAKRAIEAGDEVTYDYKFPIEDEAIPCDCSAPNCIGRMN